MIKTILKAVLLYTTCISWIIVLCVGINIPTIAFLALCTICLILSMVTSIEVSINEAARFLGYNLFEKTFLNYINKHNEKNN